MNNLNRLLMALCLVFPCVPAISQTSPELKAFQDAAGHNSVIFRGKQANPHDRPANGTPYWSSPTFVPAEIIFEDNLYTDLLVNIDAADNRALVRKADSPTAAALPPESVSLIRTQDATYVGVGSDSGSLDEGFYEVFGDGPYRVFKHVSKRLQTSTHNMNGDPIGYHDPNYVPEQNYYYAIFKEYYFVDADGNASRFKGKGALLRKFPERRKEIRKAVSAAGLDLPGTSFDDYCKAVINFVSR